ncbi:MAG: DinB family protein [Bacteroidetes bacterium]|nr:DinB family protein [Bacteroidota bacterium]
MPNAQAFIDEQVRITEQLLSTAHTTFCQAPPEALKQRPAPDRWSVLDCLEHLNRYGRFYLPRLESRTQQALAKGSSPATELHHGWLGGYSIRSMMPTPPQSVNGKRRKGMRAMRKYDPIRTPSDQSGTLAEFIRQQERLLEILRQARQVNLNKHRMGTTLGSWLTFKYGDILGFLIAHNLRHVTQAQRALPE